MVKSVKYFFFLLNIMFVLNCNAQSKIISGKIIDEHFEPLTNAVIQTLDSLIFVKADNLGYYEIEVPITTEKLNAWYVAMESNTFSVKDKCNVNIILLDDLIIEFNTVEESKKFYNKRVKKGLKPLYKKAIKEGVFNIEKPCN